MKKGYLYLILAAFGYASMGALVKILSIDTGPHLQTFLRLIVSALLTTLLVVITRKSFVLKTPRDYLLIFFMGTIGYGLQILFFTLAMYNTTIGNALFLMSGYPIVAAFLAYFFLKEKIGKNLLIALVFLCLSLFLIFQPTGTGTSLIGNLYAFGICLTFSFYIIASRILSKRGNSAETITLWSVWLGVLTTGIGTAHFEQITLNVSAQSIFFLILFGFLNAFAFICVNKGFATVPAGVGTMILLVEPILGAFIGYFFFQEIPTLFFILGALLLLIAVFFATRKTP